MSVSIQAGEVLADAYEAAEEAERLEALAEAALSASETAIEQHLVDFRILSWQTSWISICVLQATC